MRSVANFPEDSFIPEVVVRILNSLLIVALLAAVPVAAQNTLPQRTKGKATAPVTVYEMSDFQCPYCRTFAAETFPVLEREFIETGKVRWIFINFPLTQIHQNAVAAAEFAVCAARQEKFWPAHDLLYETQPQWARLPNPGPFLVGQMRTLRLDEKKMLACLESGEAQEEVRLDAEGAARSGATSTPSFYIEGGMMSGAQPVGVFRGILDSIVATKKK